MAQSRQSLAGCDAVDRIVRCGARPGKAASEILPVLRKTGCSAGETGCGGNCPGGAAFRLKDKEKIHRPAPGYGQAAVDDEGVFDSKSVENYILACFHGIDIEPGNRDREAP